MKRDRKEDLRAAWQLATSATWPFVAEHRFHPHRRWRFDWADPGLQLAIEIEGVTYFGGAVGRHQSAKGIEADMEKYNEAAVLGWTVLRYSQRMIAADPIGVVRQILDVASKLGE